MGRKNTQLNLFETESKQSDLIQIKGKTLDKNQQKFNILVAEVRKSNAELKMFTQVLPEVNAACLKVSIPLQKILFQAKLNLIKAADAYLKEMKLAKNQKAVLQDYILFKIRELPQVAPAEIADIYNFYADVRYNDPMDSGKEEVSKDFRECWFRASGNCC